MKRSYASRRQADDRTFRRAVKVFAVIWVVWMLAVLSVLGVAAYVAWHFLSKAW